MKAPGILLTLSLFHIALSVPVSWPSTGLRQCRASADLPNLALEVLPGSGWDNLRNLDMGRVMNISYVQCQTSEDGLYLIPDEVFVVPHKETGVETNSEIISSWMEEKGLTAHSINSHISFLPKLNGKFSSENQRMKSHQVRDSSTTTRVQVRNHIYTVQAYPDFHLDLRFAHQAKEIADAIENNQTRNADYLSERMVLDYGTHVITSVDAGASLVEEDYLSSSYVSTNMSESSTVKAAAGLYFFDKLKFDISSQTTQQSQWLQTYQSNIQYSLIQSHGGVLFYPGITLQKWQESTLNNLVAIDRSGFPLHYFLNANNFPDLPEPTVEKLGSFTLAAVYQECVPISKDAGPLCDALAQKNPETGAFSCQPPYSPTLLRSEIQRLPAAVLDWRPFSRCSKQLSSALHHSLDSLLRSSSSLVNNNWGLGLSLDNYGKAVLGGSRSDLAKFARSQHSVDKATFAIHEISCTYYSYRLADHPQLSSEFTKHLKRLPESINTSQSRALYRRLIDTYGTHYIHQSLRSKNCLNLELRMALGFLPANASLSNKCDNLLKGNMSMGFYQGFMTHKIEVIGGERYFPDILYQQDPSEAYHSWMNSLHENPDVVSYAIFPLHHLVQDSEVSANLKTIITEYIKENKLQEDQLSFKNCSPDPQPGPQLLSAEGRKRNPQETNTVMDNNDPVWNATYYFGSVELGEELKMEVWDRDVLYNDVAGRCVVFPERGTHAHSCQLSKGVLYFTYTVKCDAHLTGFRCGRYSPSAE
ncbi:unnamed protein product [Lampetra planeri]